VRRKAQYSIGGVLECAPLRVWAAHETARVHFIDSQRGCCEKIEIVHASSEAEIDAAFATLRGMRASALLVQLDAFLINKRIVALAARDVLPTMYQTRSWSPRVG
jgi:hypothetical protein